ncbi:MAG: inorganic phosphate transporter [Candidatus Solibacter usitatus]|nr:inorganic phosphate transporter [Candidatus Solibacter usitatus]
MNDTLYLTVMIVLIALIFDFINGFHDAANSVATVIATRVLRPGTAVIFAGVFNFAAALSFGTGVAKTVGSGMVDLKLITPYVILAGLIGAIVWDLVTWYYGLPTSSSHALFGGYAGAAIAASGFKAIIVSGWTKTLIFILIAPLLGMFIAYVLMVAVHWMFRHSTPKQMDKYFRRLQLVSAAIFSYSHGSNDAQKTMGIITGVLVTAGYLDTFAVPLWVFLSAYTAIALGTMMGGWRIIRTMGSRLTRLKPRGGFCAETAAATSILFSTYLHMPVSTTHVIAGAIAGVGSIQRIKAVRWRIATSIIWAWIMTIPASAAVGWITFQIVHLITGK